MKIIDFDRKGNIVRFYLGADDCTEYHGDDWNDAPYDCNAGTVYDEYVTGHRDVAFPFDSVVLEPCDGETNCGLAKDDMKSRRVPCIIVVPPELARTEWWWFDSFSRWVGCDGVQRYYFGDTMEPEDTK